MKTLKSFLQDERGVNISTEALIYLVGTGIIASAVIGAITVLLTGKDGDGEGGMAKTVSDKIETIVNDLSQ